MASETELSMRMLRRMQERAEKAEAMLERVRAYERCEAWDADGCPMSLGEILAVHSPVEAQSAGTGQCIHCNAIRGDGDRFCLKSPSGFHTYDHAPAQAAEPEPFSFEPAWRHCIERAKKAETRVAELEDRLSRRDIVSAADKAVLDACAEVSTPALQGLLSVAFFPALWQWAKLELARREAKR